MGTKLLLTCILLTGVGALIHAKWPDPARIGNAVSDFYHKYPQEKVALVTDRQKYSPGETIYFSAWLTCLGKPSTVSKIVYVELIDSTGLILHRSTLPVEAGAAEGDLPLPDDLPSGRYNLRAYTSWMLNFEPAFFGYTGLLIGDETPPASNADYHFDLFPEGGHLVEGLTSKVAFRASSGDGQPVAAKGRLLDSSGKVIKQFTTGQGGLGSFVVHAAAGNTYTAVVDFPGGITKKVPLPTPERSGVVLYVNSFLADNGDDSICFRLSRSVADKQRYQHLVLCAEMQGKIDFTYINFDNDFAGNYNNTVLSAPTPLSLDGFPAGVLHLTVFNDKEEVLAQRLVFLRRNRDRATPTLTWDTLSGQPHGRNSFSLNIPGDSMGIYTVSITKQTAPAANTPNIITTLFLSSDVPATPFLSSAESSQALDLLLLTSQWTRFDWNKILKNEFPPIRYFAEQSLALKGQAFWGSVKDKKPMHNGEFSLMIKAPRDSLFNLLSVPVDSEGRFSLVNLDFHDTAAVYVQNNSKKKGRDVTVLFDKDPLDTIRTAPLFDGQPLSLISTAANPANTTAFGVRANNIRTNLRDLPGQRKQKDTTILKTALVRAHRKTHADSVVENYASGMFANPGAWAKTIDLTQDRSTEAYYSIDVIRYLQGKVAGLVYVGSEPLIYWRMTNGLFDGSTAVQRIKENAPAFFLDEQMLNENSEGYDGAIDMLKNIPIAQVAMIRIFQPGTFAGVSGMAPHGVIAVYTKNGSEWKWKNIPSGFNKTKITGYSPYSPFTAPDYEKGRTAPAGNPGRAANPVRPDRRETLYWNPALAPDSATHSIRFSFYNDDTPGPFRITIQGLDRNGRPMHIDSVFTLLPPTAAPN